MLEFLLYMKAHIVKDLLESTIKNCTSGNPNSITQWPTTKAKKSLVISLGRAIILNTLL